jgi:hypothetical protein
MKKNVDLKIKYYDKSTYSLNLSSIGLDFDYYRLDEYLLIAYIIRQVITIGINHPVSQNIINTLYNSLQYPEINDVTVAAFNENNQKSDELFERVNPNTLLRIIDKGASPIRNIFCRYEYIENNRNISEGKFIQNNEGFGALGYGINYFLPLSIYILINFLIERKKGIWEAMGEKVDEKSMKAWRLVIRANAGVCCRELKKGKINIQNSMKAAYMIFLALDKQDFSYFEKY